MNCGGGVEVLKKVGLGGGVLGPGWVGAVLGEQVFNTFCFFDDEVFFFGGSEKREKFLVGKESAF